MSTRALATSVKISENVQKNLGESNHPIGRTRLIQMMQPLYLGADGMTYTTVTTCNGTTVPRWYALVMSILDTHTGP